MSDLIGWVIIKDDDENVLIEVKDGQCLLSRFKNLSPEMKDKIIDLFVDLTDMDRNKVIEFMEFEEKEQRFCS